MREITWKSWKREIRWLKQKLDEKRTEGEKGLMTEKVREKTQKGGQRLDEREIRWKKMVKEIERENLDRKTEMEKKSREEN